MLACGLAAMAGPISPEQALQRVAGSQLKSQALGAGTAQPQLVHTSLTADGTPAAYVFNGADHRGYLVLSADDIAYPVLGYSDQGYIDADNLSPQLQWWLSEYGRQIEYARSQGVQPGQGSKSMRMPREAIAPLVATKWDQIAPFNNQCPLYGTERTFTGCVATAMAQVMNYWQYPERGQGSISYTSETIEKKLSLNFGLRAFDWANMKDTYYGDYTEEQETAVAYLMKAAGYSVKMDYSVDASGALAMDIAAGLTKYFNYDGNINYTLRDYYSTEQWEQMLYDNLKNVGPLLYGGGSYIGGGHSFVCDGYDGNGYFHFNWGWSGMSDGYFSLDALTPGSLGTGGGGGGGYSFTQDAVFGIQPPTGEPVVEKKLAMTQMGSLSATATLSTISFSLIGTGQSMWVNYNPKTLNVGFGVIIEPQGDTPGETLCKSVSSAIVNIPPGYGTGPSNIHASLTNLQSLGLEQGSYKLTMATYPMGSDKVIPEAEEWVPVIPTYGFYNYVTLVKDQNGTRVVNGELPKVKITGELLTPLYNGASARWRVILENESDVEVTRGFAPCLADENAGPVFLGESVMVTAPPHSTVTRDWDCMLYQLQQLSITQPVQLGFTFFDETIYQTTEDDFLTEVTMLPAPGTPQLSFAGGPKVAGSTNKLADGYMVQMIPDPTNMNISVSGQLTSGVFAYPMEVCLCQAGEGGSLDILTSAGQTYYLTTAGQTFDFNVNINYPILQANQNYFLVMAYDISEGLLPLSSTSAIRWDGVTGIDDVTVDAINEPAEVFNLQGLYVGDSTDGLAPGIYIVRKGKQVTKVRI